MSLNKNDSQHVFKGQIFLFLEVNMHHNKSQTKRQGGNKNGSMGMFFMRVCV